MKFYYSGTVLLAVGAATLLGHAALAADSSRKEAKVTRIVREVKLMAPHAAARQAELNDKVSDGTGVRTGDESRSELTFLDLTITRLGANTIFSFDNAGRNLDLGSGSLLYRVPKDSGGAHMSTTGVTVGIAGTTVILEKTHAGRNKLTVLEGGAKISLRKYPGETAMVRGGQMIDVPAGATKLPPVTNIDLNQVMRNNPLITDFGPLPSRDLITAAANNPAPAPPPDAGPNPGAIIPPLLGGLLGAGLPIAIGGGGSSHSSSSHSTHTRSTGEHTSHSTDTTHTSGTTHTTGTRDGTGTTTRSSAMTSSHHSPTPPPRKTSKKPVTY